MGARAHIIDLETGEKFYSHWGATEFTKANSFGQLETAVREKLEEEREHREPENDDPIDEFNDKDAVEDIDLHREVLYVVSEDEVRGYCRTMLRDDSEGISDDMVVFEFHDSTTYWRARHTSKRMGHFNEAYRRENVDEHKNKAIEQALRNRRGHTRDDVEVIYSSISPRGHDFAFKQLVEIWPGKDVTNPRATKVKAGGTA